MKLLAERTKIKGQTLFKVLITDVQHCNGSIMGAFSHSLETNIF